MLGLVIYLLMMATAFMGYVLPWGQMSYWGAQVITGFFSAFPLVGEPIRLWLLGGYAPDQAALTRFFSLHYLLPFVIAAVVILHIWALHIPGSGNPTGVDVKDEKDTLPFHPFYTAKDGWFAAAFLLVYALVTFFAPNYLGHPDNYIPANPLATPAHIVPEWYFWPFYAILRELHGRLHPAGQAVGRAGDVQLDPAAVLPAVARQVAGPLGQLPAAVQALLLAAGDRRAHPRLGRRLRRRRRSGSRSARSPRLIISSISSSSCRSSRSSRRRCRCRIRSPNPCFTARRRKRSGGQKKPRRGSARRPAIRGQGTHASASRFLVGLGFAGVLLISLFGGVCDLFQQSRRRRSPRDEFHREPKDAAACQRRAVRQVRQPQVQRGFQVYSEVCSACHSLNLVAFRDLKGLGYNDAEIKKIASDWKTRCRRSTRTPARRRRARRFRPITFPAPYANETAARAANNNALPPDLSLITKAREGGAAYVYSLLTGYRENQPAASCSRSSRTPRRRRTSTTTPISRI